jgi:CDP-diacylglycerol--serine O-phosphatidyltransferase
VLVFNWSLKAQPTVGLVVSFLFVAAGAARLARFNVLSMNPEGKPNKCGTYFLGLPIPGAAGILISIVVADHAAQPDLGGPAYTWAMMVVTVVLSFLMISNVRFRSFKDMKLNVRSCLLIAAALGSSVVVASQFEPAFVLIWLMSVYVLVAIVESIVRILPSRLKAGRKSVPPG